MHDTIPSPFDFDFRIRIFYFDKYYANGTVRTCTLVNSTVRPYVGSLLGQVDYGKINMLLDPDTSTKHKILSIRTLGTGMHFEQMKKEYVTCATRKVSTFYLRL